MVGSGAFVSLSSSLSPVAVVACVLAGNVLVVGAFLSPLPSPAVLAERCASALCGESDTTLLAVTFLVRAISALWIVCSAIRGLDVDRLLRDSVTGSRGSGLLALGREELRGRAELSAADRRSV